MQVSIDYRPWENAVVMYGDLESGHTYFFQVFNIFEKHVLPFEKLMSLIMITCVCKHIPKNKHTLWKKYVMLSFFRYALQTVRVYNNRAMQITDRIFFF